MNENKYIEEMAGTLKDAAIEEMRSELIAAGYTIGANGNSFSYPLQFINIIMPDGFILTSELYFPDERKVVQALCIEKAYAHLQKERKFQKLEEFVKRLSKAKAETLCDDDGYPVYDTDFEDFIKEAKQLSKK